MLSNSVCIYQIINQKLVVTVTEDFTFTEYQQIKHEIWFNQATYIIWVVQEPFQLRPVGSTQHNGGIKHSTNRDRQILKRHRYNWNKTEQLSLFDNSFRCAIQQVYTTKLLTRY